MMGVLFLASFIAGVCQVYTWFGWWGYVAVFLAAWVITLFIPKTN